MPLASLDPQHCQTNKSFKRYLTLSVYVKKIWLLLSELHEWQDPSAKLTLNAFNLSGSPTLSNLSSTMSSSSSSSSSSLLLLLLFMPRTRLKINQFYSDINIYSAVGRWLIMQGRKLKSYLSKESTVFGAYSKL